MAERVGSNMGSSNFFAKMASVDPLAHALHLPGANKYTQQQQSSDAGRSAVNAGPYAGVEPTLEGANSGYAANGPGANANWRAWTPSSPGGMFGAAQRISSAAGQTTPNPMDGVWAPSSPGRVMSTVQGTSPDAQAYVQAAQRVAQQRGSRTSYYQGA